MKIIFVLFSSNHAVWQNWQKIEGKKMKNEKISHYCEGKSHKIEKNNMLCAWFQQDYKKVKTCPFEYRVGVGGCPFCQTLDVFIKKLQKFLKLNEIWVMHLKILLKICTIMICMVFLVKDYFSKVWNAPLKKVCTFGIWAKRHQMGS